MDRFIIHLITPIRKQQVRDIALIDARGKYSKVDASGHKDKVLWERAFSNYIKNISEGLGELTEEHYKAAAEFADRTIAKKSSSPGLGAPSQTGGLMDFVNEIKAKANEKNSGILSEDSPFSMNF